MQNGDTFLNMEFLRKRLFNRFNPSFLLFSVFLLVTGSLLGQESSQIKPQEPVKKHGKRTTKDSVKHKKHSAKDSKDESPSEETKHSGKRAHPELEVDPD